MRTLAELFTAFFKTGLFTFGGGYAMLPMLRKEMVEKHGWCTEEELMDYYAIGQCTPGIIAVNTATFIGYKEKGVAGAIAGTLGVITPSVIIIMIIAAFFTRFQDVEAVRHAFNGIRVAVVVMVLMTVVRMVKKAIVDVPSFIIAAVIFVLAMFTGLSPAVFVIAAGILGIVISFRRKDR